MTRRALFAIALSLILRPADASADLDGTRRKRAADRRCAGNARIAGRGGMTPRERARLKAAGCVEIDGEWVSGKVFQA